MPDKNSRQLTICFPVKVDKLFKDKFPDMPSDLSCNRLAASGVLVWTGVSGDADLPSPTCDFQMEQCFAQAICRLSRRDISRCSAFPAQRGLRFYKGITTTTTTTSTTTTTTTTTTVAPLCTAPYSDTSRGMLKSGTCSADLYLCPTGGCEVSDRCSGAVRWAMQHGKLLSGNPSTT